MCLNIENLKKSFGDGENRRTVLHGLSFGVRKGEICVFLGPSGSGKSTLLNIIGGIETPDSGQLRIKDQAITALNEAKLCDYRRRHLGFVFQSYNLIPNLTLKENVEVGAYLSPQPLPVDDLLHSLELWELRDKLPSTLSGGEQQRTAIGRAVVKNPDVLLCDEPTGALDYDSSRQVLGVIEQVNREYGNTVILVTHNEAIRCMADQVIRLHDGRLRSDERNPDKISAHELTW